MDGQEVAASSGARYGNSSPARGPNDAPTSFQALYVRHVGPIGQLVSRSVRDRAEAEDVCQEIWLRLYRNMDDIREPEAAPGWLYRVARRLCVDVARRGSRRPAGDQLPDVLPAPGHEGPEATSLRNERLRLAWQALAALPPRQHLALVAREVEGLSPAEIAAKLDCSVAAVETLLARARKGIAVAWARVEGSREERCRLAWANARHQRLGASTRVQLIALRSHLEQCRACERELSQGTVRSGGVFRGLAGLVAFGRWALRGEPLAGVAARASTLAGPAARLAILGSLSLGTLSLGEDGPPGFSAPALPLIAVERATPAPAQASESASELAVTVGPGVPGAVVPEADASPATTRMASGDERRADEPDVRGVGPAAEHAPAPQASVAIGTAGLEVQATAVSAAAAIEVEANVTALAVPSIPQTLGQAAGTVVEVSRTGSVIPLPVAPPPAPTVEIPALPVHLP